MKSITCIPILTAIVLCGPMQMAYAADTPCEARIQQITIRHEARYLPFSSMDTMLPVEIALRDTRDCQLALSFRSIGANKMTSGAESLRYQLRDDAGSEIPADGITRRSLRASGNGVAAGMRARIAVPAGQASQPGVYRDRILVQLLDGERVVDAREFEPAVNVLAQASIAAAGSARSGFSAALGARMDFGNLETGKEREVFLFVQSNCTYALRLRSANDGVLRHAENGGRAGTIPYRAALDGRWFDLSQPVVIQGRTSGLIQPPYNLRARIGDVSNKIAGQYRDVITVDVIMLE